MCCRWEARYPEGIDQLEQASIVAPEQERHSLAAAGSLLMVLAGQIDRAREAAQRAVETGERLGDDHVLCVGLQALAMVALAEGLIDRAVSSRSGPSPSPSAATPPGPTTSCLSCGWAPPSPTPTASARPRRCCTLGDAGRNRRGNLARLPLYQWAIAELRLAGGLWDDALAEAHAGLDLIEETANQVGDVFANAICAHVAFHRGDPTLAQSAVRRGPSQPRRPARSRSASSG